MGSSGILTRGLISNLFLMKKPYLVTGESGTGKELVAGAIHKFSGRQGKFGKIDCSAIPAELLESELFGVIDDYPGLHAPKGKRGLLRDCDGGTVQLDEINKMPRYHQEKILRVLQDKQILPVGATDPENVDVLFIATGNEDLQTKVEGGDFAGDLYDRLTGETLTVPPLRDRIQDVPALVNHFLKKYPNNPLDKFRFPLARWCMDQIEEGGRNGTIVSVRRLENLIGSLVRHSLSSDAWDTDPRMIKLREAIEQAREEGALPLTRTDLARRTKIGRTTLYTEPWRSFLDRCVQAGDVKT
jgi:transcriptional regulator with PAS, ATPase and Fis domain